MQPFQSVKQILLSNGKTIPQFGFGTWKAETNVVSQAVKVAIESGYRHIDCAAVYKNENEVGEAFKQVFESGLVKREDLFVTSKLYNTCHEKHNVRKHCEITLKSLGLDYLDLYLIHWPLAFEYTGESINDPIENGRAKLIPVPIRETWQEMEALVEAGLVKSIGVSNFNVQSLLDVLSYAKIKPVVNQVELHPYLSQPELKSFCDNYNIHLTAYSPFGSGAFVNDETVGKIAKIYNKSVPQILGRWSIQKGFSVIPKSSTPDRIKDNFNIFDFEISENDMKTLDGLNRNQRTCDPKYFWGVPIFN
eukprot:gene4731-5906_t